MADTLVTTLTTLVASDLIGRCVRIWYNTIERDITGRVLTAPEIAGPVHAVGVIPDGLVLLVEQTGDTQYYPRGTLQECAIRHANRVELVPVE